MSERTCKGCGEPLPLQNGPGRQRVWCSGRCRKTQYASKCVDCGAPTSGSEGRRDEPRCRACASLRAGAERTVWAPEAVIAAIRSFADEFGEPPAMSDWMPYKARQILHDDARAARYEERKGEWPSAEHVNRIFGSWNLAIIAAGFEPRAGHGGGGNQFRRRNQAVAA